MHKSISPETWTCVMWSIGGFHNGTLSHNKQTISLRIVSLAWRIMRHSGKRSWIAATASLGRNYSCTRRVQQQLQFLFVRVPRTSRQGRGLTVYFVQENMIECFVVGFLYLCSIFEGAQTIICHTMWNDHIFITVNILKEK